MEVNEMSRKMQFGGDVQRIPVGWNHDHGVGFVTRLEPLLRLGESLSITTFGHHSMTLRHWSLIFVFGSTWMILFRSNTAPTEDWWSHTICARGGRNHCRVRKSLHARQDRVHGTNDIREFRPSSAFRQVLTSYTIRT
jgi:hypothetical protein